MLNGDGGVNAAADVEFAGDFHPSGGAGGDQVVEDLVGDRFVKSAFVAVGPEIELERFELDAAGVGDVADGDGGEVRLAGFGAQAGEFRALHANKIITPGMRVGEGF